MKFHRWLILLKNVSLFTEPQEILNEDGCECDVYTSGSTGATGTPPPPPLGNNFHYDFLIVYGVGNSQKKVSNFFLAQH